MYRSTEIGVRERRAKISRREVEVERVVGEATETVLLVERGGRLIYRVDHDQPTLCEAE